MTTLEIDSTFLARDVLCLSVAGDIEMASTDVLDEAIARALAIHGIARVVLDMQRTTFLDSTGVRSLLLANQAASQSGIAFRIMNTPPIARRVLELTGVFELLTQDGGPAGDSGNHNEEDRPAHDLPTDT
jgi:anti-anti-sigma factor